MKNIGNVHIHSDNNSDIWQLLYMYILKPGSSGILWQTIETIRGAIIYWDGMYDAWVVISEIWLISKWATPSSHHLRKSRRCGTRLICDFCESSRV